MSRHMANALQALENEIAVLTKDYDDLRAAGAHASLIHRVSAIIDNVREVQCILNNVAAQSLTLHDLLADYLVTLRNHKGR